VFPIITVVTFGLTVIAIDAELTVRVAMLLITLPVELLTATLNCDPLSDVAVAAVVYVAEAAPPIEVPFFRHW
jgi:hypothetical protein